MPRADLGNTTRYWSNRGVPGLSMLQADFTTHEYTPHSHDGFVVAVTEQGGAIIRCGSEIIEARPGVLFVSNPAELQSTRMGRSRRWRYRSFYLSGPALSDVSRYVGMSHEPCFVHGAIQDSDLCAAMLALHGLLAGGQDRFGEVESLTSTFGRLFMRHAANREPAEAGSAPRHQLDRVLELMNQQFRDRLELADLAEVAGLTIFQLIGLFRRLTGLTPHAFLVQLRLNAAREQLKRGASLAEAAIDNGFYDQSALTKHFKRAYGITPGQFAAASHGK